MAKLPTTPIDPTWGTENDETLHVALVYPEIPPNTGSVARLCAATGTHLHLVEPLGFQLDDKHLRRAGLDYWPSVRMTVHADLDALLSIFPVSKRHLFSARAGTLYTEVAYEPGDILLFGCESAGLPSEIKNAEGAPLRIIPMRDDVRSINLATAVSVAVYEAHRQTGFGFRT